MQTPEQEFIVFVDLLERLEEHSSRPPQCQCCGNQLFLDSESLRSVLQNVDALYLNYALAKNQADIEKSIIDVAIESRVFRIGHLLGRPMSILMNMPFKGKRGRQRFYLSSRSIGAFH